MRMMLRIEPDTKASNDAIQDGTLPKVIKEAMDMWKPECAYFYPENGNRAALMVFDMDDSTDIPAIVEPFFQMLGAKVTLTPVMNAQELEAGLEKLAR